MSRPRQSSIAEKRQRDVEYKARIKAERVLIDGVLVAVVPTERHGRLSTYKNFGCRCDQCCAATDAVKNRRVLVDGVLVAPVPADRHGRVSTYKNDFCRCAPCREAAAIRARMWRDLAGTSQANT